LIKGKKYRATLTTFTDTLRTSKNFRDRQVYLYIAMFTYMADKDIFKKHFAKNIATDLENEKCKCVKIVLAKLCNEVKEGYSKSIDKIRTKLVTEKDETIVQYLTSKPEGRDVEFKRRYLAENYGDSKKQDEVMTEEEWLQKEKKEIEEIEKTVTIRFANYSTLMRAQTLTQGLSAHLSMFLASLSNPKVGGDQTLLTKQLLEKAGIKSDVAKPSDLGEANKRSLSPMAVMASNEAPNANSSEWQI
jgi:hypothetical protein